MRDSGELGAAVPDDVAPGAGLGNRMPRKFKGGFRVKMYWNGRAVGLRRVRPFFLPVSLYFLPKWEFLAV